MGNWKSVADPGGAASAHPPKGPDSFILTYKFFETELPRELVPPYEVGAPPTGNPGSAAGNDFIVLNIVVKRVHFM